MNVILIFCVNTIIIICESNRTVINLTKTIGDVHLTKKTMIIITSTINDYYVQYKYIILL